ncbi:PREDICTED: sperm-associated antigen 16 protein-like, partial [Acropora digitifera]|uniref:sperm-associated antigen 16 protein-like n=1 Tax=Acropora digitifera TaxID=70779 RepID=UPI00077AA746
MADEEGAFFLEQVTVPEDSDDEFAYEEVPVEDDYSVAEGDEDLDTAFATVQETKNDDLLTQKIETEKPTATTDLVTQLRQDVAKFKEAAERAKQTFVRLKKERDFHRMHHKRVVQEKNRLITDLKRLKKHYSTYEPTLQTLKHKYEVAMKEKMLTKLERDRAVGKMTGLQTAPHQVAAIPADITQGASESLRKVSPLRTKGAQKNATGPAPPTTQSKHPKDSEFPVDGRVNPQLSHHKGPSAHLTRSGGFRLTHTVSAHALPVSGLALHPRKQVLATVSDDWSWKMWAVPSGDIIMTGEGHKDWLSDCDFHPGGARLATSSGDGTVKIWDFSKAECVLTFTDHTHAVWGCSWHSCGDFLASCSMDNTCKVWDVNRVPTCVTIMAILRCFSSVHLCISKKEKNKIPAAKKCHSTSINDNVRVFVLQGLCAQTFYGHMHSCNHVVFNHKGDTVASCDAYGVVKMWDVRSVACMTTLD